MAKGKSYGIKANGKTYSAQYQTDEGYAAAWAAHLATWHGAHVRGECQCPGRGDRPVGVRQLPTGAYTLARLPNTGPYHHVTCRFYGASVNTVIQSTYESGVVKEEEDGRFSIRLAVGRQVGTPAAAQGTTPTPISGGGTSTPKQPAMTLRGLMDFLWVQAGLNQ